MTSFCDRCDKNDHESCMRLIDNVKLCRSCIAYLPQPRYEFSCVCKKWSERDVRYAFTTLGHFILCSDCKHEILTMNEIEYCQCEFENIQYAHECYHYGCGVCKICDKEFTDELLEKIKDIQPDDKSQDNQIDHPYHYQSGGMEVIEVIEAFKLGFPLGNVIKYILRAPFKGNGLQDLQKAKWYLDYEIKKIIQENSLKGKK